MAKKKSVGESIDEYLERNNFYFDGNWKTETPKYGITEKQLKSGIRRDQTLEYKDNKIVLEGFLIPVEQATILPIERLGYVAKSHFWVKIKNLYYGFCYVEFPILDAMELDNAPAYVRLLRGKRVE